MSESAHAALVVALVLAPVSLVLVVAILRGYRIDLHMRRDLPRKRRIDDDEA